jgi:hypothetical protein
MKARTSAFDPSMGGEPFAQLCLGQECGRIVDFDVVGLVGIRWGYTFAQFNIITAVGISVDELRVVACLNSVVLCAHVCGLF